MRGLIRPYFSSVKKGLRHNVFVVYLLFLFKTHLDSISSKVKPSFHLLFDLEMNQLFGRICTCHQLLIFHRGLCQSVLTIPPFHFHFHFQRSFQIYQSQPITPPPEFPLNTFDNCQLSDHFFNKIFKSLLVMKITVGPNLAQGRADCRI